MPNSYTALYSHIITSTKNREPVLDASIRPQLFDYIGAVCKDRDCVLLAAGGVADHIHLLVGRHPKVCESDLVRDAKANSSRWLKQHVPGFAWQDGGGMFSVGPREVPAVKKYLARQEEHHRTVSFEEEYIGFLKRYGIRYEPRYVLE